MSSYSVLANDKFENAIIKRIKNIHTDYLYINVENQGCIQNICNPLGGIWDLRTNLRFEYINKKIDENYEKEVI